jgi:uncharacterized protein (DUF1499 family)
VILSAVGVLSLVLSSLGTRGRWWHFRIGLALFALSGLLGALAIVFGALGCWRTGSLVALGAAITGLVVAAGPALGIISAAGKPMIHDISTNPAELEPKVAEIQKRAYSDIAPKRVQLPPKEAFARAQAAAAKLGWQIVAANTDEGTMKATDTTGWFGFVDDIIVRVQAAEGGSQIDVRSTSRVGKSDVGMNAKRIRAFMKELGT